MKISVVIPTYNRKASLERCLASLARQTFAVDAFEVVVVADGCSDGTVEFLSSYVPPHRFRWVKQTNQGQAAAQNAGIAAAAGEILILIDDDCVCDAQLVEAHAAAHGKFDRAVVIGAVLTHPDTPRGTLGDLKREFEDTEFARLAASGVRRSDLTLCANSSIPREAALACPFDSAYKRMHDVEAGLRLWALGYRPRFAADAVAYELFTKPVTAVLSDARYGGRYEVSLADKYPEFKSLAELVHINKGSPLKRCVRRQMAIHAGLSELLLRTIYRASEALREFPAFASIARRVLSARTVLQHLRGAIEEAGSWKEVERRFGKLAPVIIYHNVGEPRAGEYRGLTTPRAEFEGQIRLLVRLGYKSILPTDWLRWRDEGGDLPENPVMLVFDDAYEEASRVAFPILLRYGFGAVCMVVTNCIGATNRWDEEAGRPSFGIMSAEQIVEWSQRGIEFGGHTWSHPELPLVGDERVELEISKCKDDLTTLLGRPPVSFAYPFGGFNPAVAAAVSRHFKLGFTTGPGRLHLAANPALVPRIAFLPGESRLGMWCRLRLGRNPFEVLRNRWRKWMGKWPEGEVHVGGPATDQS
jgi:glycosyltransferase involved in cell wall biosynthesis/peptidoglycan/xylan/chitin deacetylase (PgdA/CDA1 family)